MGAVYDYFPLLFVFKIFQALGHMRIEARIIIEMFSIIFFK